MNHIRHNDLAQMEGLPSGSAENLAMELVGLFLRDVGDECRAFQTALDHNDAGELAAIAHRFRTSVHVLGARRAASLCEDLETRASDGDLRSARLAARALIHELAQVRRELIDYARDTSRGAPSGFTP